MLHAKKDIAVIKEVCQFGKHELILETGGIARQATGAVMARLGDTVVLATVVGKKESSSEADFFPLTVNYQERTYAAGKIPGGYFKREGRPTEKETLTSRLIDRPIRPLFPKGFKNEVQVIVTVLSVDPEISPDILSIIAASAALSISGIPFDGPVAASRVGYKEGEYLLNPSESELLASELDLVVAGTESAVLMVESEAKGLSEEVMLGAVLYGHEAYQNVIKAINTLTQQAGKPRWNFEAPACDETLNTHVIELAESALTEAYQIADKAERKERIDAIRAQVMESICPEADENPHREKEVQEAFSKLEKDIVRQRILEGKPRIDGRDTKTVRPIHIETGVLPRTHGSAVFTRGETQAIIVATLGTEKDAQYLDELINEGRETFMLHYNFPPYCVGEVGFMSGPKRREIGHGKLAKRAIEAILPTADEFPYTIRVVSETTESNGSSSMAAVCGTCLSLMDAGVPIKAPVAGIAMGLVKGEEKAVVLTDILGDEDHLGDMDFKVAGTADGITALQMDIKIKGITKEIMETALSQARAGRLHILGEMKKAIDGPREQMSRYAPRITTFKIDPDKIRDVIGKGGATIRELTEETGATIDIEDDGTIKIAAVEQAASDAARSRIEEITSDVQIGKTYEGKVEKIVDFGAFVAFGYKKSGLVHVSQIKQERVEKVSDELSVGQGVRVKVLEIDRQGRVRLSMKEAE